MDVMSGLLFICLDERLTLIFLINHLVYNMPENSEKSKKLMLSDQQLKNPNDINIIPSHDANKNTTERLELGSVWYISLTDYFSSRCCIRLM